MFLFCWSNASWSIFDPLEPHCISSRAVDMDIYCMSFYCKNALVGGNDNEREVAEVVLSIFSKTIDKSSWCCMLQGSVR